ncbi:hypothetical protein JOM56_007294 [Amanita muscaria]
MMPGMRPVFRWFFPLTVRGNRNAEDLIKDFWSRKKKGKQETKAKRGRKSTATMDEESDDLGSVSAAPKKRGRKPKARTDTEEIEESDTRVSKKARTDTTHKTAQESNVAIQDDDQDVVMSDMGSYDSWPSWEDLIRSIDTIEKDDSGKIQVYFTLKSGAKVRESSENCRKRCPQKLISFYEEHLRWKEAEVEEIVDD